MESEARLLYDRRQAYRLPELQSEISIGDTAQIHPHSRYGHGPSYRVAVEYDGVTGTRLTAMRYVEDMRGMRTAAPDRLGSSCQVIKT